MNAENKKLIQKLVGDVGDELKGKLFPTQEHPERNSYAHIWKCIKTKFGVPSYAACTDAQVPQIIELIENIRVQHT